MKLTRSALIGAIAANVAILAMAPSADAAGGRGGGTGVGGVSRPSVSVPHSFQRVSPPSRPVFGPGTPARRPPPVTESRPIAPHRRPVTTGGAMHDFRHQDFRHFNPTDKARWSHGKWHHGWHRGVYGWWWFVAGYGYWYEEPIYPYPDYVSDEAEPETDEEAPPDATPPEGLTGPVYYYCSDPSGYYPYVATCNVPWQTVPAAPSQ